MSVKVWHVAAVFGLSLALGSFAVVSRVQAERNVKTVVQTVGELRVVHAEVLVAGREVRGSERLSDGDVISTGPGGRARVRLDDGTLVAVAADTRFSVSGKRLTLERGRIFLNGGARSRIEVGLGSVVAPVVSSAVAFEKKDGDKGSIYCAEGELMLSAKGAQARVVSGETATVTGARVQVAPEKAFDDWTFGLAVPWGTEEAFASAIPEVRAATEGDDPGTPLVVRSQRVATEIDGEFAVTRARTTLFNGGVAATRTRFRLALPVGAVLRRVARKVEGTAEIDAILGAASGADSSSEIVGLEWAGGGVVRGGLGPIAAGQTVELVIEYGEWLAIESGRAAYRFPLASADPELVGELGITVDATRTDTRFLSANAGAKVENRVIRLRQTDARPSSDLAVEIEPSVVRAEGARAYVVPGAKGEDPYVLVRTELPDRADTGVTLVLVLDTSMSVGREALEAERAVLDAVLEGLGPRDSLVVLAADQAVQALGPEAPTPVNPAFRTAVRDAAMALRPGGATDLGAALVRAADILDAPSRGARAGQGMIVYVGDGRASVGDMDPEAIRRLVGRRGGGMPRLSAVAVGPNADPWFIAKLVEGAGELYEVSDPSDAARASTLLLENALLPTLRDVELDLGPDVDRVYPRRAHTVVSGSTVSLIGRLRGKLPTRIGLRYRDGAELVERSRLLYRAPTPRGADLAQRWASARIVDMAARDDGIEAAVAVAQGVGLLTPWTSFFFEAGAQKPRLVAASERELSPLRDSAFGFRLAGLSSTGSTLLTPSPRPSADVSLRVAAEAAIRRVLGQASQAVRACRDARSGVRPDLGRRFEIDLRVDADGRATRVRVIAVEANSQDPVLERCIRGVVQSLPFFAAGLPIDLKTLIAVPEARSARRTRCSGASQVALPIRKQIWRARVIREAEGYLLAAGSCELPTWADRRAFLNLLLERVDGGPLRLDLASRLESAGESDAAAYVRREALRRVKSFYELEQLGALLRLDEPRIDFELDKAYAAARDDEGRLAVIRRFLELSPHSELARRRLLRVLEALGRHEVLEGEIARFRADPLLDAGLLADGAAVLRRMGRDAESRRVFGELLERAPRDPWTLAYVGDRLRAEGLFDEALAAYQSLARALPNEAQVSLRLGLAQAGAGRLDVATRLFDRVSQTGGRSDDGRMAELAAVIRAVLLARARSGKSDADAELERRLLQTPLPDVASILLIESPPADDAVEVSVRRERGEAVDQSPDLDASPLGVAAIRIERGDGTARLSLRRKLEPGPSPVRKVQVSALLLARDSGSPKLVSRTLEIRADGKPVEIAFDGDKFL